MSEIIRRDPRREWIARNRLHPDHASVLAALGVNSEGGGAASEWLGPNGVVRKNPRAIGFIGPNGVKRIDRSGLQQGGQASATTTAARDSRRRVTIDQPAFMVAVVPDLTGGRLSSHDKDLLGLARRVADADAEQPGAVVAILFGEHKEEALGEAGIDRIVHLDDELYAGFAPEARLAVLGAVEREMAPRFWLLPDSPLGGADLGRRLALRLGERAATGVWQVEADNEASLGWRCTARGAAGSLDIQRPLP
ncbi:MAG: electron transfer flavoprotein subunit alpha/FixB family protein, partial [Halomonas venusta]|nr:electron transfer flavoprotein subunit alpha/FixB family protein [Halomonas venusta]